MIWLIKKGKRENHHNLILEKGKKSAPPSKQCLGKILNSPPRRAEFAPKGEKKMHKFKHPEHFETSRSNPWPSECLPRMKCTPQQCGTQSWSYHGTFSVPRRGSNMGDKKTGQSTPNLYDQYTDWRKLILWFCLDDLNGTLGKFWLKSISAEQLQ